LPFVQVGLLADFWLPFERYDKADRPWRSTFFIVPFRGRPGKAPAGGIAAGRGVPYGANEIAPQLRELAARGHEIALHGIDAWWDGQASREELGALRTACDADVTGVRMHWLFFDDASPGTLDLAGFDYDATVGYNDAVGFRAGTAQVFAPLDTEHLLELPLMIQDTSLLYPSRMHCREDEALAASQAIVDTVHETGGVATISWHERSLSPERLWDRVYHGVLAHLRARDASVRPAREVVAWFRTRRSVSLEGTQLSAESVARLAIPDPEVSADALRVRIHHPLRDAAGAAPRYTDLAVRPADLIALVRDAHALAI